MAGKPTESSSAVSPEDETDRETHDHEAAGPLDVERLHKDDGRALILYTLPTRVRRDP